MPGVTGVFPLAPQKLDLLMIQVPPMGTEGPPLGPALLTACAKKAGFQAELLDFNIDFFHRMKSDSLSMAWLRQEYQFERHEKFEEVYHSKFHDLVSDWLDLIERKNPRWIGLSLFSHRGWDMAEKIAAQARERIPHVKIVVGGDPTAYPEKAIQKKDSGLIDAYVCGEGEEALLSILKDELHASGINGVPSRQVKNLNLLPGPDYSQLPLSLYGTSSSPRQEKLFYIEGSRGCIRKCGFCEVPQTQPGYRFRDPEKVVEEIQDLYRLYGARNFFFVDSLINGSLKHLKSLLYQLTSFRLHSSSDPMSLGDDLIYWGGYAIVRPEETYPPFWFNLLSHSGCQSLAIGIESGSERVRKEMNKQIRQEDIDYTLEQCHRVGIKVYLLLMVGYPSETDEDFEETLDMLKRYKRFAGNTIHSICCSWRVGLQGINYDKLREPMNLKRDAHGEWYSDHVNAVISARRYFKLREFASELGYGTWFSQPDHLVRTTLESQGKSL